MLGILACETCATGTVWSCESDSGGYVPGHIPAKGLAAARPSHDFDAWSHLAGCGTHAAMVLRYPHAALNQGAADYLRWVAARPTTSNVVAQQHLELQGVIDQWDARPVPQ